MAASATTTQGNVRTGTRATLWCSVITSRTGLRLLAEVLGDSEGISWQTFVAKQLTRPDCANAAKIAQPSNAWNWSDSQPFILENLESYKGLDGGI